MASVIVTIRIMPTGTEVDMKALETACIERVKSFGAMSSKAEVEPIAFGLNALKVLFVVDEAKGDSEPLEKEIATVDGVQSVEVTDVRRTFG